MRPPHYTGENSGTIRVDANGHNNASMRPPHYTGENGSYCSSHVAVHDASMRPPHYTGENLTRAFIPVTDAAKLQ